MVFTTDRYLRSITPNSKFHERDLKCMELNEILSKHENESEMDSNYNTETEEEFIFHLECAVLQCTHI